MVRSRTNTGNSGFGKNAGLPSGRMSRVQKRRGICGCGVKSSTPLSFALARKGTTLSLSDAQLFREIDADNDGFISVNELATHIREALAPAIFLLLPEFGNFDWEDNIVPITVDILVEVFIDDRFTENQKLSSDDFVTLMSDPSWVTRTILKYGFKKFDTDNNGFINYADLGAEPSSVFSNLSNAFGFTDSNVFFSFLFGKQEINLDDWLDASLVGSQVLYITRGYAPLLYLAIYAISRANQAN